jgi:hypothetical protein
MRIRHRNGGVNQLSARTYIISRFTTTFPLPRHPQLRPLVEVTWLLQCPAHDHPVGHGEIYECTNMSALTWHTVQSSALAAQAPREGLTSKSHYSS